MNFDIESQSVQVYTCADGTQFYSFEEARTHNEKLKQAYELEQFRKEIETTVESYCNQFNMEGRNRAQKTNVVTDFLEWYLTWDKQFVAATKPEVDEEVVPTFEDESIPF